MTSVHSYFIPLFDRTEDAECTELESCALDDTFYPSAFMVTAEWNRSTDEPVRVFNKNLKEYKQIIKTIAI